MTVSTILLLVAFLCFVLAALNVPSRIDLTALGLAFWVLTLILPKV